MEVTRSILANIFDGIYESLDDKMEELSDIVDKLRPWDAADIGKLVVLNYILDVLVKEFKPSRKKKKPVK